MPWNCQANFWKIAWDSEGIALISGHVETGETLPQDKLDALLSAKTSKVDADVASNRICLI